MKKFTKMIPQKTINQTLNCLQETCQQIDALILLLDDSIEELEAENRRSLIYLNKLKRAKKLLNETVSLEDID